MMRSVILIILYSSYVFEQLMDRLNAKSWTGKVPDELEGLYNVEEYTKAMKYDKAKHKLARVSELFSLILMTGFILTGSFALVEKWAVHQSADLMFQCLLFFGVLAIIADIIATPFSLYSTFVIEEQFGFNRSTFQLFFMDKLKGYLLGGLLGGSLLSLFVLFYQIAGTDFWWIAWICISAVTLLISMFYASWILPMFNKLTPLPEGELREGLQAYCKKVGFPVSDLFVMDGSKRSSKANAFFSGLGPKKKIVLFDTLVQNHSTEELIAIMAHEVGHFKKKHTLFSIVASVMQTGLMLYLFSRVIANPALAAALGASKPSLPLGMMAFALLYAPVSMFLSIIMNKLSRKHEYEADAYAAETFAAKPLVEALKKLSKDSLSNLNPHPFYVSMYYSHPTLLQRMKAMGVKE
jgi:STE24 endopeptidase